MNKSSKSLLKRIESLVYDAEYVRGCAEHLELPVIANQRCGNWYVPPDLLAQSCYFKSTDGHVNHWAFNHRRLNLHFLALVETHHGCIIVDSTRGHKQFPDALSKTIPIWCAVLNRLLFPDHAESQAVVLPSSDIIASEEFTAIKEALPALCEDARGLSLDVNSIRNQITRPLRPHFLQPPATSPASFRKEQDQDVHNIILLMASSNYQRPKQHFDASQFPFPDYIRGAGDDEDNWARELTPALFWKKKKDIIGTLADPGLDDEHVLRQLAPETPPPTQDPVALGPAGLFIGITSGHLYLPNLPTLQPFDAIIACDADTNLNLTVANLAALGNKTPILQLNLQPGKVGSRQLRTAFPSVITFLSTLQTPCPTTLVTDKEGKDHAVAVALLVSCLFYSKQSFTPVPSTADWTKEKIRRHLAVMTTHHPDISPSRASLQSLHAFLMPPSASKISKRLDKTPLTR